MSYAQAVTELRQLLADSDLNKKATKKKLIGKVDGNNTLFFSYDKRIFPDSVQIYVNNEETGSFSVDDEIKGQITLGTAPEINAKVEASYYWRFWIDDELKTFLNKGAESTGQFNDIVPDTAYLKIQAGLKSAALYFAANMATDSLVHYLINRRHSSEFLLEQDGNTDTAYTATISGLRDQAKSYWDKAVFHRDDFYKRLGKRNAPAFAIKVGSVRQYGSKR
jgi:hypothetical protein